jgi:hypothetical protein
MFVRVNLSKRKFKLGLCRERSALRVGRDSDRHAAGCEDLMRQDITLTFTSIVSRELVEEFRPRNGTMPLASSELYG